jgi:hypothetical protein
MDAAQGHEEDEKDTSILVNATKTGLPLCPGDIRTVLSSSGVKKKTSPRQANNHETIKYCVSNHHGSTTGKRGALVDCGANGGLVGNDVRIMCTTDREGDVSGIDNHLDKPTGTDTPPDPDIQPTKHHPGGNHVDDITPDEDIIRGRPGEHTSIAIIDANDIIGRSYLQEPEEDGTQHRLRIIAKLDEHDGNIANDPTMI